MVSVTHGQCDARPTVTFSARHQKKTWWNCFKNDMESLGLSGVNGEGELSRVPPGHGKSMLKKRGHPD